MECFENFAKIIISIFLEQSFRLKFFGKKFQEVFSNFYFNEFFFSESFETYIKKIHQNVNELFRRKYTKT